MSATEEPEHLPLPLVEESEIVFDDFGEIRRDILRLPSEASYAYYSMTTRKIGVLVVATTKDEHQLVLVEEYRHPTKRILLGLPGGFVDDEESPLEAAQRELLEETGFSAEEFTVIGKAYPLPGLLSQITYYVRAKNAQQTAKPQLEGSEILRPVLLTKEALKAETARGRDVDASLCAALFFIRD